ncbi:MAG: transglutaminase-like cysteine peptidase [Microvirga sp.]|nr:transglutaminase-like cysteine peptidase [Microvirga sp.]
MSSPFTGSSDAIALEGDRLTSSRGISAPSGFSAACGRYGFLCGTRTGRSMGDGELRALASRVNSEVNWSIRSMTDSANYGRSEYWTLPDNGAGDCEDYALLKKKRLIESGVDSRLLSMAVALDGRGENHVVLMLRLSSGDVVLDNLRGSIVPWSQTGYTFIARQSETNKRAWRVALAGPRAAQIAARTGERIVAETASRTPARIAGAFSAGQVQAHENPEN